MVKLKGKPKPVGGTKDDSGPRELPPAGEPLDAVCVDVIDKPNQEFTWNGETKIRDVLTFVWVTAARDSKGRQFRIYQDYTNSSYAESNLHKMWDSWHGRQFTDEELEGVDTEEVIGKLARVIVSHRKAQSGKTYARVGMVLPGKLKVVPEAYKRKIRVLEEEAEIASPAPSEAPEPGSDDPEGEVPF